MAAHRRRLSACPCGRGARDHGFRARAGDHAARRCRDLFDHPLCDGFGRAALARCGDANRRRLADYRLAMGRLALLAGLAARPARFAFFATADLDDQVAVLEALRLVLPESLGLAAPIAAPAAPPAGPPGAARSAKTRVG